jgi:hypothetical protein
MPKGTASIGLSAALAFNDRGNGTLPGNGTYVDCVNITSLGIPNKKMATIESKTLDIANYTPTKIPGLFEAGSVTCSWELVNANTTGVGIGQFDRLELLKNGRTHVGARWTVPTDGGNYTIIKTVLVTENDIQPAEADGKIMVNTTIDISGA